MQQAVFDFDALAREAPLETNTAQAETIHGRDETMAPAARKFSPPAELVWNGQRCRVNWMRQMNGTYWQAGVSFPDQSATLLVVKVQDGQAKPVLCWCHGPRQDGVMDEDERQARAACTLNTPGPERFNVHPEGAQ